MVKIKQKKTMNLPQLIEWAYHQGSDVRDEKIKSESMTITFSEIGTPHIETKFHFLQVDELFTVEIEEEVTEDTVFNYLLLTYKKDNDKIETHWYEDKCKKSVLSQSDSLMYVSKQLSITYFDDKGIPHLIWTHEKGMVE